MRDYSDSLATLELCGAQKNMQLLSSLQNF